MDGNIIINQNEYYEYLYKALDHNSLLPHDNGAWRIMFQNSFDRLEIDKGIITELKNEFGYGFENIFLVNSHKTVLLRKKYTEILSKLLCQTSVYFSVLGCVLDFNYSEIMPAGYYYEDPNYGKQVSLYVIIDVSEKKQNLWYNRITTRSLKGVSYALQSGTERFNS